MSLEEYRKEIDNINNELAQLIAKRMDVVEKVGEFKEKKGMQIRDKGREEKVKEQFGNIFSENSLPKNRGREFAEMLIEMAVKEEKEVLNE